MPRNPRRDEGAVSGQIGVRDPFQLIRHLAKSQSDPRKAVAELVQNALDEQANHITLERRREGGEPMLSIFDDGRGVLPELPRPEALRHIAKNIGNSRKHQLSFDDRMRKAMLGQYGIGILGFWALGHEFRMISRVNASEVWALTLWEDSPKFEVERAELDLSRGDTWTEVQVRRLHRAAMAPTLGSRLNSYLSMELRGQLLKHGTELVLIDKLSRSPSDRRIVVRPAALSGERLAGLSSVSVPGFDHPIELQLFYAGENPEQEGQVKLACAGAVALDALGEHPDFAHPPWTDARLAGVVDFPHLEIPPGSRRGFVPNEAASAFTQALVSVEADVLRKLEERDALAAAQLSSNVHKQLAKMFSKATGLVPHLEWFPVSRTGGKLPETSPGGAAITAAGAEQAAEEPEAPELFPPGPLANVRLLPRELQLGLGEEATFRARAEDAHGRRIPEGIAYEWAVEGAVTLTEGSENKAVAKGERLGQGTVQVTAIEGERRVSASASVEVLQEALSKRSEAAGIPQPEELNEPLQPWRSRTQGEKWQINVGHPDYRALAEEPRRKVRYLAHLLAKEIISRNFPRPEVGVILEELVGLLAALERSGAWARG
jgi:hypothetical protein